MRPELVLKSGISVWGASGDGNATTALAEPVRVQRQVGADGAAAARLSLAFLAGAAFDADLPITRPRARVEGCRELTAADMVRNARTGDVRVDPRDLRGHARRRAGARAAGRAGRVLGPLPARLTGVSPRAA